VLSPEGDDMLTGTEAIIVHFRIAGSGTAAFVARDCVALDTRRRAQIAVTPRCGGLRRTG
jgi:hypothetical protein